MKYKYPSTTSRTPRPISQYHRYKSSEFRLILLFAAPVFRRYLKPIHYKHYLLLVIAFHMAESRVIVEEDIDDISVLLSKIIIARIK